MGRPAIRGQGWGIDGQINIPPLGLMRCRNLCPGKRLEEQGQQPLVGGSGSSGARGITAACLRLQVRRPGIALLSWLRGERCIIVLGGMVGMKNYMGHLSDESHKSGCYLEERGLLFTAVIKCFVESE